MAAQAKHPIAALGRKRGRLFLKYHREALLEIAEEKRVARGEQDLLPELKRSLTAARQNKDNRHVKFEQHNSKRSSINFRCEPADRQRDRAAKKKRRART